MSFLVFYFLFPFFVMLSSAIAAVALIDEAARAAEQHLGSYTGEEHAKHALVVRKPRLNRTYLDSAVRLAER